MSRRKRWSGSTRTALTPRTGGVWGPIAQEAGGKCSPVGRRYSSPGIGSSTPSTRTGMDRDHCDLHTANVMMQATVIVSP